MDDGGEDGRSLVEAVVDDELSDVRGDYGPQQRLVAIVLLQWVSQVLHLLALREVSLLITATVV